MMRLNVDKIERTKKKKNEIVNNVTECEYYVSMVRHKSPCIKIWINFFVCFNILFYIFRLPFHWVRVCLYMSQEDPPQYTNSNKYQNIVSVYLSGVQVRAQVFVMRLYKNPACIVR